MYEWDDTNLIRETVTYKATNKTYDIWYFYDGSGNIIGYEYSYINEQNQKSRTRIYYEKDLQGNVIGLLDARGAEIATYAYDAWGNITGTVCYEGYETAYNLNHVTYRSYYRDDETGFYYLQSRYYDPEICRFVNADDVTVISVDIGLIHKDNLYIYCNGEPVNRIDYDGTKSINITSKLSGLMIKHAMKLYTMARIGCFAGPLGMAILLNKFYNLVKTGGEWDLKRKKEWILKKGDIYLYFKSKYSAEDVGNIHFGFVGSVLFSWNTLRCGAGLYQIYSGTSSWSYWYTFFDSPRDSYCISIGRIMWKILFLGRFVYQW